MRHVATLAVLFAASAAPAADGKDKPAVREVPTADLKVAVKPPDKGKATEPYLVTRGQDLIKVTPLGPDAVKALAKQVDFDKDKLVVFWWGGSGQDKVAAGGLAAADKKTTATFTYTPGATDDYRGHLRLFVVPKDAEVKVETARRE